MARMAACNIRSPKSYQAKVLRLGNIAILIFVLPIAKKLTRAVLSKIRCHKKGECRKNCHVWFVEKKLQQHIELMGHMGLGRKWIGASLVPIGPYE